MFDWVEYETPCLFCNQEVKGFQSKDAECTLDTIKPHQVVEFYSSCDTCGAWVSCVISEDHKQIVVSAKIDAANCRGTRTAAYEYMK